MRRALQLGLIILLLLLLQSAAPRTSVAATAEENFRWFCAQCHGPEGRGDGVNHTPDLPVQPRNLTDPKDVGQFSDEEMVATITKGGAVNDLSAIMPPWGDRLSEAEIRELVRFIRGLCGCQFDPALKSAAQRAKPPGSP
ncbi:MAG: cytochrome c [candidate division NC10 bacterium]|nr:cytochrome c [candidate division NC10 bacterium]